MTILAVQKSQKTPWLSHTWTAYRIIKCIECRLLDTRRFNRYAIAPKQPARLGQHKPNMANQRPTPSRAARTKPSHRMGQHQTNALPQHPFRRICAVRGQMVSYRRCQPHSIHRPANHATNAKQPAMENHGQQFCPHEQSLVERNSRRNGTARNRRFCQCRTTPSRHVGKR